MALRELTWDLWPGVPGLPWSVVTYVVNWPPGCFRYERGDAGKRAFLISASSGCLVAYPGQRSLEVRPLSKLSKWIFRAPNLLAMPNVSTKNGSKQHPYQLLPKPLSKNQLLRSRWGLRRPSYFAFSTTNPRHRPRCKTISPGCLYQFFFHLVTFRLCGRGRLVSDQFRYFFLVSK